MNTFYQCSSLQTVVLPNNLKSIGPLAFGRCKQLRNIIIPNSVTDVDETAFSHCPKLLLRSASFEMSVVDYYRASHQDTIKLRVAFLTSLRVYQAMREKETRLATERKLDEDDASSSSGCGGGE